MTVSSFCVYALLKISMKSLHQSCSRGLEYPDSTLAAGEKKTLFKKKKRYLGYDTKLHLLGSVEPPLGFHYAQIHSVW